MSMVKYYVLWNSPEGLKLEEFRTPLDAETFWINNGSKGIILNSHIHQTNAEY